MGFLMSRADAIQDLRSRVDEIARTVTSMHPIVPRLEDGTARNEILRALFELTKQVEMVKKTLIRLEKGDESKLL